MNNNLAIWKNFNPTGIPIIVIHKISPVNNAPSAPSHPNSIAQIIFAIGCLSKLVSTFLPNGVTMNLANLKH